MSDNTQPQFETFMVRPFDKVVRPGEGRAAKTMKGIIEGSEFILCLEGDRFGSTRYPLETVSVGEDADGPYAIIREFERPVEAPGWRLKVEPEYSQDLPTRCRIGVERLAPRGPVEEAVRREGIDPKDVEILVQGLDGVCVYLDSRGRRND